MSDNKSVIIIVTENGPYVVKNLGNFSDWNGQIESRDTMALCRCGQSASKPFCDGTHATIGFSSSKGADRTTDSWDHYRGEMITIHDNRGLCAHAGVCTDRLADVFRMGKEPWIAPDAAEVKDIVSVIENCPSGALSYTIGDADQKNGNEDPCIVVTRNGPYQVTGEPGLEGAECAEGASTEHFTLCRCGISRNKPFCDGSHWQIDFENDGE